MTTLLFKRAALASLFLAALISGVGLSQGLRIAYVSPSLLFAAHPAGQAAAELMAQRDSELTPLVEELQALQSRAETDQGLTPDERARANLLLRTVQETQARYTEDIRAAAAPAEAAINAAIEAVARANGFTLVLDGELAGAGGSSLIIYADPEEIPDITDLVIAELQGQ
jgi:outer membrane protein